MTHDGASVDVAAEGADGGTTIALFWKADTGLLATPATPEPDRADSVQPVTALAEIEPVSTLAVPRIAMAEPPRIDPLPVPAIQGDARPRAPLCSGAVAMARRCWPGGCGCGWQRRGGAQSGHDVRRRSGRAAELWQRVQLVPGGGGAGRPCRHLQYRRPERCGPGPARNPVEAVDRYTQAAAKGVGRAAFNLALLYERGDGVEQDSKTAEQYFRQAERQGVRAARAHLPGRTCGRSAPTT